MLTSLRNQIDQIDKDLVKLLLERYEVIVEIAVIKRKNKIRIEDKERENEIIEGITANLSLNDTQEKYIRNIMFAVHDSSKSIQKSIS
ncbi:chorismate mutase [bacterium]|nr:chorismate mutase [bacterium]